MTENILILALLCAIVGLALILSSKVLVLFITRIPRWRWLGTVGMVLWTLSTLFLVLDVIEVSHSLYVGRWLILVEIVLLAILVGLALTGMQFYLLRSRQYRPTKLRQVLAIILITLLLGWSYTRFEERSSGYLTYGLIGLVPGDVELDNRFVCETDTGTQIPVFRLANVDAELLKLTKTFRLRFAAFGNSLIHRGVADEHANCHGWVFTGGKFLLKGEAVERILADHHYDVVDAPMEGDLVIYRNSFGIIVHTALVQAVLNDGTVITESKWGVEQRFLHLPNDQPYSTIYEYYRTNRPNHLVRIRSSKDSDSSPDRLRFSEPTLAEENG